QAAPTVADAPRFDVDALYWLRVRPQSVAIDARFQVNVHSGRLDRLRLAIDPPWKPVATPAGANAQVRLHPTDPRTVQIDLSRSITSRGTIDARFVLERASGIGSWRPPTVQIQGAKISRRAWAASIDPSLVYQQRLPADEGKLSPADFSARWSST